MDLYEFLARSEETTAKEKLLNLNEKTCIFGLTLTGEEAGALIVSRNEVLKAYDRIEWDFSALEKLIETFSTSDYIQSKDYLESLMELVEIFHYAKNQTEDYLTDSELVETLFFLFEEKAMGDLEVLREREVEAYIEKVWSEILTRELLRGEV